MPCLAPARVIDNGSSVWHVGAHDCMCAVSLLVCSLLQLMVLTLTHVLT